MPNSLTAQGLTVATRSEWLTFYQSALYAIYGTDASLDSSTPDGQWINILIQVNLDIEDWVAQVFSSFDPDNAIGVILDQRVAINGIQRQKGTYTTTNVTIVTSQVVNLYGLDQTVQPIYTVADNVGNQWKLVTTQLGVSVGTNIFLFQAATPGPVLTTLNTITIPVSIVLGVTSINNPTLYATLGVAEESDVALKIRRQKSVSLQTQGFYQGLIAALENINGITSAFIVENDSGGLQVSTGLVPGHSIWVIVSGTPNVPLSTAYSVSTVYQYNSIASSGGINYISVQNGNVGQSILNTAFWRVYNPIAQAIYNYRNAGCGMFNSGDSGAESYTVTQIDGTFFTVYWDFVVQLEPILKIQTGSLNLVNPPNVTAIINYITANFIPTVNEELNINQLTSLVQQVDSNTLALFPSGYGFSPSSPAGPFTYTLSPPAANNQFVISSALIIILPIVLSCPNAVYSFGTNGILNTPGATVSTPHGGSTIQFSAFGGYSTLTYSVLSGAGSINSSSGLYTSAGAGTDVVKVIDTLGNIQTVTVTVT